MRISPRPSRKGPKKKWKTIQLPEDLIQHIDNIIAMRDLGYTSRNEFIKEAIRLRTEQIREQKKIKV